MKSITLKPRAMTIAEALVELDNALCVVEEEGIYPGVYIASSVCQVNSNKAIVRLLNPTEESIEIANLKRKFTLACI
jgi:hypothetical protein